MVRAVEGVRAHEGRTARGERRAAQLPRVRPRLDARGPHAEQPQQLTHVRPRRAPATAAATTAASCAAARAAVNARHRAKVGCDGAVAARGGVIAAGRTRVEERRRRRPLVARARPQEGERRERVVKNVVVACAVLVTREHDVLARGLHAMHALQRRGDALRRTEVARCVEHDLRRARHPHVPGLAHTRPPAAETLHAAALPSLRRLRPRGVPLKPAAPEAAV